MPSTSAQSPVRQPRWQRRPAQRSEEITAAALRVFARRGLHQTALEDVAKEAGVSKGTIYLYFKSKEDLFIAAAQQVVLSPEDLTMKLPPSPIQEKEAASILRAIARQVYRRFRTPAYLAMFGLIAAETLQHPEWGQLYFEKIVLALNHRVAELFRHIFPSAADHTRTIDPILASRAFLGTLLIMAMTQEHLGGKQHTPFSEKHIIDTLTNIFLHGVNLKKEKGT